MALGGRERRCARRALAVAAIPIGVIAVLFGVGTQAATFGASAAALVWLPAYPAAADVLLNDMAARGAVGPTHPEFERLAAETYRLNPTDAVAIRSLALAAYLASKPADGDALYRYALQLSRRDLPTLIYMIEMAARSGDAPSALHYYDIALRVSPTSKATLMLGLSHGLSDKRLLGDFVRLARSDPPWLRGFADWLLRNERAEIPLAELLIAARAAPIAKDAELRRQVLARLVKIGALDWASAYYRSFAEVNEGPLAFGGVQGYPPFDWAIAETAPEMELYGASLADGRLRYWSRGGAGLIAQKLVMLPPGTYRLLARRHDETTMGAPRLTLSLHCASRDSKELSIPLVTQTTSGKVVIDPSCAAHWINIDLVSATDDPMDGVLDTLTLDPVVTIPKGEKE